MKNLELWNKVSKPPEKMLKKIGGGRLKGMTDINPQWRILALTEQFGICGIGWKYLIDKLWTEKGTDEQSLAFAQISLFINIDNNWSDAIVGVGGSMMIDKESNKWAKEGEEKYKYNQNDECYKMAITDALSVACKMIGIGAEIYLGNWNGSKYINQEDKQTDILEDSVREEVSLIESYEELKSFYSTNKNKYNKYAWFNKVIEARKVELESIGEALDKNN